MYVVIFRARVLQFDEEYAHRAARLRALALEQYGCIEFHATTEGAEEIALSYWPDLTSIQRWKADSEHLMAQQFGQERWYSQYTVEIAEIQRRYTRTAAAVAGG